MKDLIDAGFQQYKYLAYKNNLTVNILMDLQMKKNLLLNYILILNLEKK